MAFPVLLLLIFVPIGLFMMLRPKQMWWTFAGWSKRNPEANEPSDAGYAFYRLGGLLLIVAVIWFAHLLWTFKHDRVAAPAAAVSEPSFTSTMAPARSIGAIPIVGYQARPEATDPRRTYLNLAYLVPAGTQVTANWGNAPFHTGCAIFTTVNGEFTDHLTVDLQLIWTPPEHDNPGDREKCRVDAGWSPQVLTSRLADIQSGTKVFTSSSIVDPTGNVLKAAAPDNPVPNLP